MLTKTVEIVPGVNVTVKTETGRDALNKQMVYAKLAYDRTNPAEVNHAYHFAVAVTQTTAVSGDLGFKWVTTASSSEEMQAAFEGFLDMPATPFREWLAAIEEVDTPPGDKTLAPPETLTEAQKNDPN